ncbi:hypothetical protein [Paenibacillus amylolyticus]|uniref:DUF4829 domain-containing protein n=1 Tax=Paenibacillus amylolyticus TaxID=1451 RepID=A0ABD8B2J4_PAEAM
MTKRSFYAVWLAIFLLGGVGIGSLAYTSSLNQEKMKEQTIMQQNRLFVEGFFNFETTNQRYKAIRPYTTEKGYRSTFPSGIELPPDSEVHSTVSDMKAYLQHDPSSDKKHTEVLNKFSLTTEFNGIGSVQTIVMKTVLVDEGRGDGWKVDDIEMIIQNTH